MKFKTGINMYDYLIIGSGFFGATCAYELTKKGYKVCVLDRRNHAGGNCYTEVRDDIPVNMYGPQVFHTSNEEVWKWITRFSDFNNFKYSPIALAEGKFYQLPINMWTFYQMHGTAYPAHVTSDVIARSNIENPQNLEEQAIKNVGVRIYKAFIENYAVKYWGKHPKDLPKELIKHIPVKLMYDNHYYNDRYEGMPTEGYTPIFNKLLEGVDLRLGQDFFLSTLPDYKNLIYTGPIDKYFNYRHGKLEYRSLHYKHKQLFTENHQGVTAVYFTSDQAPNIRVIENKHFYNKKNYSTWITWESPVNDYTEDTELMYPTEDKESAQIFSLYEQEFNSRPNVFFGGKLATYKNLTVAETIKSALELVSKIN